MTQVTLPAEQRCICGHRHIDHASDGVCKSKYCDCVWFEVQGSDDWIPDDAEEET